jgi:hypothetical protein
MMLGPQSKIGSGAEALLQSRQGVRHRGLGLLRFALEDIRLREAFRGA